MKPIPANRITMSNMVRSIVSLTNATKRKTAKVAAPALVAPSENACPTSIESSKVSNSASKGRRTQRRRKKNRALTEAEFSGCILCYLDKSRNKRSHSDANPKLKNSSETVSGKTDGGSSPKQDDATRPFKALHFSTVCAACSKRGKADATASRHSHISPLPQPLLPLYSKIAKPKARRVQFLGEVPKLVFDETLQQNLQQPASNEDNEEPQQLEQQPRPSWDDLLRSLKKDRRRTNNFALTADEFEDSILPDLRIAQHQQQAVPPSA